MIVLGISVIGLALMQASIAGPTKEFRDCLHDAAAKATSNKVSADGIEAYLQSACTVPMGALKDAVVAFRLKNGMSKKAAADDAQMTIDDYVGTSADNYRFMAEQNAPKPAAATPASAPATAPTAQPKPATPQQPQP
ncbi:MAG TPA: hypothetical protein VFG41_01160 [Sphingomicrobium sp.]|nr:hypothetical protein [Sphingomicrobium sp.]